MPPIERCEVCGSLKLAGSQCPTCAKTPKPNDKDRARLEYERKQQGQQKHGKRDE